MPRYSVITNTNPREIVLLKSTPCKWGKCTFCDYIADNDTNINTIVSINKKVLSNVKNIYSKLEVINSGSCFELPQETLNDINDIVKKFDIRHLLFESHLMYKNRLHEFQDLFSASIVFNCGIETFDSDFRNVVLNKGIYFDSIDEVSKYFKSVYLLVGIQGQTKKMIANDIDILLSNFKYGRINIFNNNSTKIKQDCNLIRWFLNEYSYLYDMDNIEILMHTTDFGVGN